MKAIRFHEYGSADKLMLDDVPRPEPGPGQVLVRVRAAGVAPFDWKLRQGVLSAFVPIPLPFIPGVDLAGTIEATGPDSDHLAVGDAVFGTGTGTYAEYALADINGIARKPERLTFEEAGSVANAAVAAWAAIVDAADVQPGQRVLVNGAAGGVGQFAVQLARLRGATVFGTASAANLDFIRSLGAEAIDYTSTRFEDVVSDVDVVVDNIGGETEDRSWQVMRPGGMLVSLTGFMPPAEAAERHGMRAAVSRPADPREAIQQLAALLAAGDIRSHVRAVFPLADAGRAHVMGEAGHGRGRIVLQT
jgi:NADPH:quinone reductase-like Zn-dependent oxidoreductase